MKNNPINQVTIKLCNNRRDIKTTVQVKDYIQNKHVKINIITASNK